MVEQHVCAHDEHARVPAVFARGEIRLRGRGVRFFDEALHNARIRRVRDPLGERRAFVDVAERGRRARGGDADRGDVPGARGLHRLPHRFDECDLAADHMVGGERTDDDVAAVAPRQHGGGECDRRRRVAWRRLGEDLVRADFGQLFAHGVHVVVAGAHAHMVHAADLRKAVIGGLDERAALAEQVVEELGPALAAERPQARAGAAGGNDGVEIVESVGHGDYFSGGGGSHFSRLAFCGCILPRCYG